MSKTRKPFVDFRAIRERLTVEQVLEHYGVLHTLKRKGNRLSGPCPIHNGSNPTQFRVETDRNIWNCFSECKHGGNTLDFIAKKENCSVHDAALKACEWFNIRLDEVSAHGARQDESEDELERSSIISSVWVRTSSSPLRRPGRGRLLQYFTEFTRELKASKKLASYFRLHGPKI